MPYTGPANSILVDLQAVSSNTRTAEVIKSGWSFVNANAVASTAVTITFPTAFPTSILQLRMGVLGARTSSDPAAVTDFNVAVAGEQLTCSATGVSTTGFTLNVTKSTNFAAGVRYGLWWEAAGT